MPGMSLGKIFQKGRQRDLRLVEREMVDLLGAFLTGCKQRATRHDPGSEFPASGDDPVHGFLVNPHGADEHVVGPFDVLVAQRLDPHIHQFLLPQRGKHRRHRQQAQGRQQGLFGDDPQRMLEAPECLRTFRANQKYLSRLPWYDDRMPS